MGMRIKTFWREAADKNARWLRRYAPMEGLQGKNVGNHGYHDARASNCTMPDDKIHKCWVRHGTFGGELHVDKNGVTCAAVAGSIICGAYHGFLHHGHLMEC